MTKKNPLDVANSLVTYFVTAYKEGYGKMPDINRTRHKFGIKEILQDYNATQIKGFLDYYLSTAKNPDLDDFVRNYDQVIRDMKLEETDRVERAQLRAQTGNSVAEFRKRFGNK